MSVVSEREYEFTRADFEKIRALIYQHVGISLADSKQPLVYSRLSRRLRALGLQRFCDYIALLTPGHAEWELFTNALTTNLTSFFREQHHFPALAEHVRHLSRRPIRLWSAAASTGEEPYSIAMTMVDLFGSFSAPVKILATDVDTGVLETAQTGIYSKERIEKLSSAQRKQFFLAGRDANEGFAKTVPELQNMIAFRQLNLLDDQWPIKHKFDAIFCRNVMIYFDKPTQRKLIEKFVQVLQPDGLFFAGHSETFSHSDELISPIGKTVYRLASPRKHNAAGVRHDKK